MSVHIRPLRLDGFEQLPKHARRCVFWEVDPETLSTGEQLLDPEFEKEAWLSMVMLEWGSCGQIAASGPAESARDDDEGEPCQGYVLYAPPRLVPRAQRMPTGPVSPDAVLLTSMAAEAGHGTDPADVSEMLIAGVVTELVRRGVRALEVFGRTPEAGELVGDVSGARIDPRLRPAIEALGDCSLETCMIDAHFLQAVGFTIVAPHRYFPRLRLELDRGLGWKAEVEAALDRLLETPQLQRL
ncbi:MAG: acetyltransferase [Mycobacteriaceae bacterium]